MTEQSAFHTTKIRSVQYASTATRSRIRAIAYWASTFAIVSELVSGSVWNLLTIEWINIQLHHLGYPHFFAYILGAWQAGAAIAISAPGFPLIKEWAYAGAFLLWSGAVVSHLAVGDGVESWLMPLVFVIFSIASWMLRPADRRLRQLKLRSSSSSGSHLREWTVSIGILVVLYIISFLTLPTVEHFMHKNAVELGWIWREVIGIRVPLI